MPSQRAQWPHTVADIVQSLDGIWGLVGATAISGNLLRLERSLFEPTVYTLTEYEGDNEAQILQKKSFSSEQKEAAVGEFARQLGFSDN